MLEIRTCRQPAMCSVQKAASLSVTSFTTKFSTASKSIILGRKAVQTLGHSWKSLSSLRSRNTLSPCPSITPRPEMVTLQAFFAPRKKPPSQPVSLLSSSSPAGKGEMSSSRRLESSTAPEARCSSTLLLSITVPLRNRPAGISTRPPPCSVARSTAC